ncbi:hypothetical protein TNCV_2169341 [Trichonephila clavipes]|nr:hypothetical protein TNCV_2169341 [Trichonephila clavipes]
MNKSGQTVPFPFLTLPVRDTVGLKMVYNGKPGQREKAKEGKRGIKLRENLSWTKTGKIIEGGCALKIVGEGSNNWKSQERQGGEVASADEEAARKYPEKLAKIIKDGEYCAHQVFNADETGLFWKNANPYLHCKKFVVDEALNDDDILESMVDITKDLETVDSEPEEDVTPLDEKLLREGLQLSELYKELVPSQSLITDYLVKEKKITEVPEEALPCRSDDVILSSSDESDLAPIHKRVRTLSDSE